MHEFSWYNLIVADNLASYRSTTEKLIATGRWRYGKKHGIYNTAIMLDKERLICSLLSATSPSWYLQEDLSDFDVSLTDKQSQAPLDIHVSLTSYH